MLKKHMRKAISVLTTLAILMTATLNVLAGNQEVVSANSKEDEFAVYSVLAEGAPQAVSTVLEKAEVDVYDDTLIEVLPLNSTGNESVLVVTNEDGATVTKEIILSVAGDGTINDASELFDNDNMTSRAGGGNWLPWQDGTLVRAVAVYNKYLGSHGYYQPQSCYFIYYDNGVDLITYVSLDYKCHGYEYTYPGYEPLYDGDFDTYEHTISVVKSNPAYSTIYMTNDPYRSDRIICTNGGVGTGQSFDFTITINGREVSGYTVAIYENDD